MKGAMLGAAFGHLVPKMSGFVHVDSPRRNKALVTKPTVRTYENV